MGASSSTLSSSTVPEARLEAREGPLTGCSGARVDFHLPQGVPAELAQAGLRLDQLESELAGINAAFHSATPTHKPLLTYAGWPLILVAIVVAIASTLTRTTTRSNSNSPTSSLTAAYILALVGIGFSAGSRLWWNRKVEAGAACVQAHLEAHVNPRWWGGGWTWRLDSYMERTGRRSRTTVFYVAVSPLGSAPPGTGHDAGFAGGHPLHYHPQQQYGFPPQGFPGQGFPGQGFPGQGFPPQGFPPQGFPGQSYPPQSYAPQGYPPPGYPPRGGLPLPHPDMGADDDGFVKGGAQAASYGGAAPVQHPSATAPMFSGGGGGGLGGQHQAYASYPHGTGGGQPGPGYPPQGYPAQTEGGHGGGGAHPELRRWAAVPPPS